ncbi:MAG: efflux RND transporter permease subunit, partial [Myxococcota bacterium]
MSITRAAILNDRLTLFALVAVFTLGASAYFNLPRAEDPGFTIRTARVMTIFPGASPERVASLITDKLETVIQEIPEVDNIVSTSKTGVSLVTVNIKESETDMRPIWDTLRRKVEQVTPDLPEGTRTPEVQDELGDVFGIVFTLTSDGFT